MSGDILAQHPGNRADTRHCSARQRADDVNILQRPYGLVHLSGTNRVRPPFPRGSGSCYPALLGEGSLGSAEGLLETFILTKTRSMTRSGLTCLWVIMIMVCQLGNVPGRQRGTSAWRVGLLKLHRMS